jgi:hypothetical protein
MVTDGQQNVGSSSRAYFDAYALGNCILLSRLSLLPAIRQELRLHLIGDVVFVVLLIPAIIGPPPAGVGAATVWLYESDFLRCVIRLCITLNRLNLKWYVQDVLLHLLLR